MTLKPLALSVLLSGGVVFAFVEPPPSTAPVLITEQQTPPGQQPKEIGVRMDDAAIQPKLAVPEFLTAGADAELQAVARTVSEVLWADLDFEKEFYLIDRRESSAVPLSPTVEGMSLDRWKDLGADFVVHASVSKSTDGEFAVDLRIVTTRGATAGKIDFSSLYERCTLRNPRWCAHSIADDIHKKKRNLDGVARTKVAFVSDRDNRAVPGRQVKEIYVMDYDGANQRAFTAHRSLSIMPAWASDGVSLAYVSYFGGNSDIYLTRPDGRAPTRPANGSMDIRNYSPAVSPDGKRLLFASSRDVNTGRNDIFIVNMDGTGLKNLTPNTASSGESTPSWSPSGTEIVFTSDRTGTNQLYLMSPEGLSLRRLPMDKHCDKPTWSLLNFIAFAYGPQDGPHDIALYDLQTNKVSILTDGNGSNNSPAVSANGRHVVFTTTRFGGSQLAVVSRRGGAPRQLTTAGSNTYPNWSRPPQ
jgi:TolB protein